MKSTLLALMAVSALFAADVSAARAAEKFTFDQNHTNIVWHANHFGFSNPSGRFGVTEGILVLDEAAPEKSTVNVTIDVAGLNTGIPKFDEHLKSADFLDTAKFPTATFKSTKVDVTGKDTANVTGDLTLHGVTKPVTLEMKLNKLDANPMNNKKTAGFSGKIVLKRSEYGNSQYVPNVSDDITIGIEAETVLAE
jgi:polyisoprenoid-binding protein YceI